MVEISRNYASDHTKFLRKRFKSHKQLVGVFGFAGIIARFLSLAKIAFRELWLKSHVTTLAITPSFSENGSNRHTQLAGVFGFFGTIA